MRRRKRDSSSGIRPASSILEEALSPEVRKGLAVAGMAAGWTEIVGEKLARQTAPESLEKTVLTVVAATPSYAQEITMRGGAVAAEISKRWEIEVTTVKARVGRIPRRQRRKSESRRERVGVSHDLYRASLEEIKGKVDREDVEKSLARLMALYRARFRNQNGGGREARGKDGVKWTRGKGE